MINSFDQLLYHLSNYYLIELQEFIGIFQIVLPKIILEVVNSKRTCLYNSPIISMGNTKDLIFYQILR